MQKREAQVPQSNVLRKRKEGRKEGEDRGLGKGEEEKENWRALERGRKDKKIGKNRRWRRMWEMHREREGEQKKKKQEKKAKSKKKKKYSPEQ